MTQAKGIHAHKTLKLGLRKPKNAPALELGRFLTGVVPAHPAAADHFADTTFGLYENDRFGDCGPVSVANLIRLVSRALTGTEIQVPQDAVFDLYRRSGNPTFDPATGEGDDGVDLQTMLEALLAGGIGGFTPLAFAKLDPSDSAQLNAAVSIFGGVLWGVQLQKAQQAQTDEKPPVWDYKKTPIWGGHAVLQGRYDEAAGTADVISWALDVETTAEFDQRQLQEAWVVVWPWNIAHPAFQAGIDLAGLSAAYQELTGRQLVIPGVQPVPAPDPSPAPSGDPDEALWSAAQEWATVRRHYGETRLVAEALNAWAQAKGLEPSS